MSQSLRRIRLGAFVLAAVFLLAVFGYRWLGGYDWLEAVWMVVITISTVGYGEASQLSPGLQLLTIVVILLGLSASAYTFGGLFQFLIEGELETVLGSRRMTKELQLLQNHIVICGYGRIGLSLANELAAQGRLLVVIEQDLPTLELARSHGHLCLLGNATEEETLLAARVQSAKTLVTVLPSDAENVFISLSARNLAPKLQIIARAEQLSTEKKLRQAGADKVLMPTLVGARQMLRMITRPSTADWMEMVAESSFTDLELDELTIPEQHRLVNVTVRETEAHRKHKLLVVATKLANGNLVLNPDAEHRFQPNDIVMLMGRSDDIRRFRLEYQV